MLAIRNVPTRQPWLVPFCLCLGLANSGCGGDSNRNADAPVLSPADAPLPDAPLADAAADLATAGPDLATPDAPATGMEVSRLDLGGGSVDESVQEAGAAQLDARAARDGGALSIDGPDVDSGTGVGSDASVANPACTSLVNPVFILTGDTQVPVVRQVGKVLRAQADPTTLVWFATGSCSIFDAFYNGGNMTANGSYIPADPSWDAKNGSVPTCTIPAGGLPPDLGIPIGFASGCGFDGSLPAGLGAIKGPVQSFVFVVPTASIATAISAEEAYLVFGFGQAGGVSPWINEDFYFVRPASKGTQVSLGAAINVPAAKWKGKRIDKSNDVASGVATATSPDQAIGILGTEIFDSGSNRKVLRALTLQGYQQTFGYLPDSIDTAFDKRNVRDGHYIPWSHVFYLTSVDASGTPSKPRVRPIVDAFTGGPGAAAMGIDTVALTASNGLIPTCAMTVQRSAEAGEQSTYAPPSPCGCAFEAAVGRASAACETCTSDSTCRNGTRCSYGYCEASDGRISLTDCAGPTAGNPLSIINNTCDGRYISPRRPMPQKQIDNGGVLPPLP
jgi:hypothetical protein